MQIMAMPEPLSGSASSWASTGTRTANSGRQHLGAEKGLVALVGGMGDQGDAGRDELGPGRLDLDGRAVSVGLGEAQPVVEARVLLVDELGLGDRGAEVDVPQRRRLLAVGLAPGQQA